MISVIGVDYSVLSPPTVEGGAVDIMEKLLISILAVLRSTEMENDGGLQVEVSWQLVKAAGMFGCLCQSIFAQSLSVDTHNVFILLPL